MEFCAYCGNQMEDGVKFCPKSGKTVTDGKKFKAVWQPY